MQKSSLGFSLTGIWRVVVMPIVTLLRSMRISYLPPLMVYMAAGVSGLTAVVASFYVKGYLGLTPEFLASLGFWAGIPWALKMPMGHLVDLMWRFKSWLIVLGASLIALSLLIMFFLISNPVMMSTYASLSFWYVLSSVLSPIGYVVQDVVADAMTVEAVPLVDVNGNEFSEVELKSMNTTMQALGRIAIMFGGILVSLMNVYYMDGVGELPAEAKIAAYAFMYKMALAIPVISLLGIFVAWMIRKRDISQMVKTGIDKVSAIALLARAVERPKINWWILGGGAIFVMFTVGIGMFDVFFGERVAEGKPLFWLIPILVNYGQEIIFVGSMTIVIFLMSKLLKVLSEESRRVLIATAIIIFVFRALPSPGAGSSWWMMDVLKFDEHFMSILSVIGSSLGLVGIFAFRGFMAKKSIAYICGFLTVFSTLLSLPIIGMYWGLHEWTSMHTGGIVDARFISIIDTAIESPLGQVAMIPMLAWIAQSAPQQLKATFFAVMASFTNLALSLSSLGTKYLNQIFVVKQEVLDMTTHAVKESADYSQLGSLFIVSTVIGLTLPFLAIWIFGRRARPVVITQ